MGRVRRVRKVETCDYDLNRLFDMFIAEKKRLGRSGDTIRSYTESQKRFMDFLNEEGYSLLCSEFRAEYIDDYIDYLRNDETDEVIKPSSVNHYLRETRAFLYWCQDHYGLERFPVNLIKEPEIIKDTYTSEEQRKLVCKPREDASFVEWRTWAIANWVLGTGNRASTICNIQIGDIDFEAREIHLRRTKNKREQIVPLSRELESVVTLFIQMWRANAEDTDYLFCNISAEQLSVSALKQSFYDYTLSREVAKTSIHAMRHTFAKAWVVNGGEIIRLQMLLGHKTLEMTRHYVNMLVGDLKPNFENYNPLDNLRKKDKREKRVTRTEPTKKRIARTTIV